MNNLEMDTSHQQQNILLLPIEVLRKLCNYLSPKSCVALMLSCRALMYHLNSDILLWKSITSQLCIPNKINETKISEDIKAQGFFPSSFQWFINVRHHLKNQDNSKRKQNSSRLEYNIGFHKQVDPSNVKIGERPLTKDKLKTAEELIVHSTIVYAYDESFFVLIQTKDRSEFWTQYEKHNSRISISKYSRATVYSLKGGYCQLIGTHDLPFEVAAQDIMVYKGMLFLLPIKYSEPNNDLTEILSIFTISDKPSDDVLKPKSSYCLQPTTECPERYRLPPHVYKESGEKRIYVLNNNGTPPTEDMRIFIIAPCPIWSILVLKLNYSNGNIALEKEMHIPNVCFDTIGQVFTADQKNSTLAFALYTTTKCKKRHKSMISVVDVNFTKVEQDNKSETSNERYNAKTSIEIHNDDLLTNVFNNSFNLNQRVDDMRLYYLSATNYYHTSDNLNIVHESSRKLMKKNGFYAPIIVLLLASDSIVLYSKHHYEYVNLQTLFGKSNRFQSKNWHHSELQVQDKVLI